MWKSFLARTSPKIALKLGFFVLVFFINPPKLAWAFSFESFDSYSIGALSGQGSWIGDGTTVSSTAASSSPNAAFTSLGATGQKTTSTISSANSVSWSFYLGGPIGGNNNAAHDSAIVFYAAGGEYRGEIYTLDINSGPERALYINSSSTGGVLYGQNYSENTWHEALVEFDYPNNRYRFRVDNAAFSSYQPLTGTTGNIVGIGILGAQADRTGGINPAFSAPDAFDNILVNGGDVEPVILVPGLLGTRLNRISNGGEVWPDGPRMINPLDPSDAYLNDLRLATTTGSQIPGFEMTPTGVIKSELGGVFYGNILNELENNGYSSGTTLFTDPYDWRFDISENLNRLNDVIQQATAYSPTGRVSIVAHSMGGLLTKTYLAQATSTAFLGKLILAGVPQLGSPKAFKALNYGDDFDMKFLGLGLNQNRTKVISQNMPGVYELLPSRKYIDLEGGYIRDYRNGANKILTYDETKQFMLENPNDSRNSGMLSLADTFHQNLDTSPVNAPEVYNIMGCGWPTFGSFRVYDDKVEITPTLGDGTVPLTSAIYQSGGFAKNYFAPVTYPFANDHLGLVKDGDPVQLILNILNGQPNQIPPSLTTSSASCFASGQNPERVMFSSHSPVTLHIYDSQNRHMGPDANGDIELGIPGASYEVIGHNRFALLPAGDTYRTVLQATDSGSVDLEVEAFSGATTTQRTTYLDVPLASASTSVSGIFAAPTSSPVLDLDADGNGVPDGTVNPTSVLTGTSTEDVTPPVLTMPQIPNPAVQFSTTTLVFSAVDAESGLLRASGTIDGVAVVSGQVVSFPILGEHVFRFEAKDLAGNPVVQEIHFSVGREASFQPFGDTFVDFSNPNANYGTGGTLQVQGDGGKKALLFFSSGTIGQTLSSSTILAARLELPIGGNSGTWSPSSTLEVHRMRREWEELGATWNCANDLDLKNDNPDCFENGWNMANATSGGAHPWISPATSMAAATNATSGLVIFDLLGDVQHLLLGDNSEEVGPRPWSWLVGKTTESVSGAIDFFSRERRKSPLLRVIYLPQ